MRVDRSITNRMADLDFGEGQRSRAWPWVAAVSAVAIVLPALFLGWEWQEIAVDADGASANHLWGRAGVAVAPLLLVAALGTLSYLLVRSPRLRRLTQGALSLSLFGALALVVLGIVTTFQANDLRADWRGLSESTTLVFTVIVPLILGMPCILALVSLQHLKPSGRSPNV